ncbi:6206_t:CDS:2, partial [Entrophospora sp. SA101]
FNNNLAEPRYNEHNEFATPVPQTNNTIETTVHFEPTHRDNNFDIDARLFYCGTASPIVLNATSHGENQIDIFSRHYYGDQNADQRFDF